ncbi:CHAT domain-containing protein [Sphingomonas tabacisoli]|uniref:CHAT domain-containing protein n=1 Tax=Sphingomonas tabacisoli TaxID=2249466 RepID=A0ABW4I5E7_9SPHN
MAAPQKPERPMRGAGDEADLPPDASDAGLVKLYGFYRSGQYLKAVEVGRPLVKRLEAQYGPADKKTLKAEMKLAQSLYNEGALPEAEQILLKASRDEGKLRGLPPGALIDPYADLLAFIYEDTGRENQAERILLALHAYSIKQHGETSRQSNDTLGSLSSFYINTQQVDAAERFTALLMRSNEIVYNVRFCADFNKVADVALLKHDLERAENWYKESLKCFREVDEFDSRTRLTVQHNYAFFLQETGRLSQADTILRDVLSTSAKRYGEDDVDTAYYKGSLGRLLLREGRPAEAIPLLRHALSDRLNRYGPTYYETLRFRAQLVRAETQLGQDEQARSDIAAALSSLGQLAGKPNDAAELFSSVAQFMRERAHDTDRAIFFLKQAVNSNELIRSSSRSGQPTPGIDTRRIGDYETLQELLIERGRFLEAEQVGRLLKADEFRLLVRGAPQTGTTEIALSAHEKAWIAQLDAWRSRPSKVQEELASLQSEATDDPARAAKLADLQKLSDSAYATYKGEIETWLSDVKAMPGAGARDEALALQVDSGERLQSLLTEAGPRTVLLQIVALPKSLHFFLTTPTTFKHVALPVSRESVFQTIAEARSEIDRYRTVSDSELAQHETQAKSKLNRLYDLLFKPIRQDVDDSRADTILLNLQGQLRYAPFAALYDGSAYLVSRYASAFYTPAVQTRFESPVAPTAEASGFGVSRPLDGLPALPAVKQELDTLLGATNGVLRGQAALDGEFTLSALENSLAQPKPVLHLASHFILLPGAESSSFLLLGDGQKLTLTEINRSPRLRFRGIELVTLSACETAVGGEGTGVEIEGLGALVQNKGAKSVLASLWSVADKASPALMADFYTTLKEGHVGKAEALRRAQVKMLSSIDQSDPFLWAPFILMGNPR